MENKIELKSISELLGMNFFIPSYQRGYRWTTQQVKDLLEDIQEFLDKKQEGFYCIQPLVVKKGIPNEKKMEFKDKLKEIEEEGNLLQEAEDIISKYTKWEVIDGQQRLTTIFILLSFLGKGNHYQIEYETRSDSKDFLKEINTSTKNPNIDYFHMIEAKKQIEDWFIKNFNTEEKRIESQNKFLENLLENVKFIWYESVNENPIKVFTRLNIGKISLTNAELIKALFLSSSNFSSTNYQKRRLQQQKIAGEWDNIECTLQNDEFWLFLNKPEYNKPTRIDFIFDLMCEKNALELTDNENREIGNDEHKTFRYFYRWFKKQGDNNNITFCWQKTRSFFHIFQEWYNDLELFHYIGFLIENKVEVSDIIDEWNKENQTKENFKKGYIISKIKEKIKNSSDLYKKYEVSGFPKTQCRPILLLHNIQTIINQNKNLKENEKYKLPVFYKFPFHLFKKEDWDVEHIASNTDNALVDIKAKKEWLKCSYEFVGGDIKKKIKDFIGKDNNEKESGFEHLHAEIVATKDSKLLNDEDKNKIWNFALLDASTNRSYGNDIFPAKRRTLIGKDQGVKYLIVEEDGEFKAEVDKESNVIAFIPPCTKNVFLKYYNPTPNNLREWDEDDAEAYKENIRTVLNEFL